MGHTVLRNKIAVDFFSLSSGLGTLPQLIGKKKKHKNNNLIPPQCLTYATEI